ncbi:hypothetical protein GIB67_033881 [Kingdonia uniflora]|uniref:Translocon-associated protein subunit alpha n=1 Tax=Kingdonia uniflora TaxID=39325 RepID=A0A7J7MJ53_9MAGN|nr:hypothetical protein GIB67_033881 [Kingdonia uniflora]
MAFKLFFLAFLLLASPLLHVVRSQSESEVVVNENGEGDDVGFVGDEAAHDVLDSYFSPAPGVSTVCVFPKNSARIVPAGEEAELLVGVSNEGESNMNVIAIKASIHLPFDHTLLVQNLTRQEFYNASVPLSAQATFPYIFAVNKYLQPGTFDLVGTIVYEIDQQPYQSTFYNGTIEVVEASGFISIESVFLVTLGAALLGLLGLWIHGQIQNLSKKTKRAPKVEVGTGATDASMDEWLQGTAYAQSVSKKITMEGHIGFNYNFDVDEFSDSELKIADFLRDLPEVIIKKERLARAAFRGRSVLPPGLPSPPRPAVKRKRNTLGSEPLVPCEKGECSMSNDIRISSPVSPLNAPMFLASDSDDYGCEPSSFSTRRDHKEMLNTMRHEGKDIDIALELSLYVKDPMVIESENFKNLGLQSEARYKVPDLNLDVLSEEINEIEVYVPPPPHCRNSA